VADVSVRPARAEDAERVAAVQLSTWRTAYDGLLPAEVLDTPLVQVAALWLGAVERPPTPAHRLLVALERDELVGFAALQPEEDDPGAGELASLLVEPRWGRRGHGSRLLAAAVDTWRLDGVERALAWVWDRDVASRRFLTAAGWEVDGAARGLDTGPRVERQVRLHTDLREG
jgi:GNAT superfamily N-acetyltransferase